MIGFQQCALSPLSSLDLESGTVQRDVYTNAVFAVRFPHSQPPTRP